MAKRSSLFTAWFEAQFGPRNRCAPKKSDADLRLEVERGEIAARLLRYRSEWDEKRTAALYAYNIKDADKKG